MGYLPAAKRNCNLNTMTFSNKAPDMTNFEVDIVLVGKRPHLNFFDNRRGGAALGVVRFFLLRVTVLVEVHHAADRWMGGGRDLDQIEIAAFRQPDSVASAHDSGLSAVSVDHSHLRRADGLIHANRG